MAINLDVFAHLQSMKYVTLCCLTSLVHDCYLCNYMLAVNMKFLSAYNINMKLLSAYNLTMKCLAA